MAKQSNDTMDKIVSLCKRRGFIFQSSEIYGGLASCYDYGPPGVELKNNVKKFWWKWMVRRRNDIVGLDAAIPDRDKSHDFQPMYLDTAIVGPDRKEVSICRQTEKLPLPH